MRFHLISDNIDTLVGMRLASTPGILTHDAGEVHKALNDAIEMKDVTVVLITERLISMRPELVYNLKLNLKRLLIVEIPDRHGSGHIKDSITRYVREAIGVKI